MDGPSFQHPSLPAELRCCRTVPWSMRTPPGLGSPFTPRSPSLRSRLSSLTPHNPRQDKVCFVAFINCYVICTYYSEEDTKLSVSTSRMPSTQGKGNPPTTETWSLHVIILSLAIQRQMKERIRIILSTAETFIM